MNARLKAKRFEAALWYIVNVLGPREIAKSCENKCQGCRFEMGEALLAARSALQLDGAPAKSPPWR